MPAPRIRILFVTAEPAGPPRVDNATELQEITNVLVGQLNITFELLYVFRATRAIVLDALRRTRPDIVHFLGHGSPEGLIIEGADGGADRVSEDWLVGAFSTCETVRLVYLNACNSARLAVALTTSPATSVLGAVAWADAVRADYATRCARRFYAMLAEGEDVADATWQAAMSLENRSVAEDAVLALRHKQSFILASPEASRPQGDAGDRAVSDVWAVAAVRAAHARAIADAAVKAALKAVDDKHRKIASKAALEAAVRKVVEARRVWERRKKWLLVLGLCLLAVVVCMNGDSGSAPEVEVPLPLYRRDVVDIGDGKLYFFRGEEFLAYDIASRRADAPGPRKIADNWAKRWPASFGPVDAAVRLGDAVYFFGGSRYLRVNIASKTVDRPPRPIAADWQGWPEGWSRVHAAVTIDPTNRTFYAFKDSEYVIVDALARKVVSTPRAISSRWKGVFQGGVDMALKLDGKLYFFRRDEYQRFDLATHKLEFDAPRRIAGDWKGVSF